MECNEADYNSRHLEPTKGAGEEGKEGSEFTRWTQVRLREGHYGCVREAVPDATTLQELQEQTQQDAELSQLKEAISRGYFTTDENKTLGAAYNPVFTELAVVGGLVVRGARIVVPRILRAKVVRIAHEGHQGITRTKEYLHSKLWSPGIDRMVEAYIQHCHPCQVVTVSQERELLLMSRIPSEACQEVAIDFFGVLYTQVNTCWWRATHHCTTKMAPADIMFPNRKFRTRLQMGRAPRELDFDLYQRDLSEKIKMKKHANKKRQVKTSDIQVGDSVLTRREVKNKGTPAYDR
ncbi:predicted protein [Nematostella vectensis]|uniref:Integrase zinc-binding domain-containing protein n=1 Tax=Nematostella vectensis TaxID=45351 RepID=A7SD05_NEMVE|nr:predicted protein [Nematostella vectensis]|eukprot:XP_001630491.1 predicted protein [Nematostella vectensis]